MTYCPEQCGDAIVDELESSRFALLSRTPPFPPPSLLAPLPSLFVFAFQFYAFFLLSISRYVSLFVTAAGEGVELSRPFAEPPPPHTFVDVFPLFACT